MMPPFAGLPSIPAIEELKKYRQWVAWKYEFRNGPSSKPTKPPISPRTGFGASHSKPETWGTYQDAFERARRSNLPGVGFVLADGDEICGIDLDACRDPDTGEIEPWAAEIVALAETYAEVSPSGEGIRLFARGKPEKTIKADKAHVEIYGKLRYLTVTGQHVDGTPDEIRPAPQSMKALVARVEAVKQEQKPETGIPVLPPGSHDGSDFFERVNAAALANLSSWVPSIFPGAKFQQSTGAYRVPSRDLGRDLEEDLSIAPNGIVDFGVHDMGDARDGKRSAVDLAMEYGRGQDAKSAAFWLCDRLGRSPDVFGWEELPPILPNIKEIADNLWRSSRKKGGISILTESDDGTIIDSETGEVIEVASEDDNEFGGALDHHDFPDRLMHPGGVVEEMADWICDTTGEPIRIHAIGAALAAVGTLLSRKVYSRTRPTGTHIYVGAMAPTGFGKDHAQSCIKMILDHVGGVGGNTSLHMAWASSAPKLGMVLLERAGAVMIVDEFSDRFAGVRSRNASVSMAAINETFKELWGRSQSSYSIPTALSRSDTVIHRPGLSFFGSTTISDFKETLVSKDVTSGLYNRFLFLPRFGDVPTAPERDGMLEIPERLAARCRWLYDCLDTMNMPQSVRGDTFPPKPQLIPFSDVATAMNEENRLFQKDMQRRSEDDQALALYGRFAEQIKRIGMIVACGRSPEMLRNAEVSKADMTFARALVTWSIEQTVLMVRRDMVENWIEANRNKVLGYIRRKKTVSRSNVLRHVRSVKGRDLDEIIKYLIEAECIKEYENEHGKKGGRPVKFYRYLRG